MYSRCFSKTHVRHTSESGLVPLLVLAALGLGGLATLFIGGVTDCSPTDLGCLGLAFGAGIVKVIFGTFAEVAEFIYKGVASLLQWIVSNMLSIPVAPHANGITPVVTEGWKLSLSLVNAILLLVLVFVGLATILRLKEYELQRLLPRLLIVALLVNFSGVFVGLVVDIANILANFFFGAVSKVSWTVPWPGASGVTGSSLAQIVASSIGIILYYLIAILIYLGLIFVLVIRTFVLWVLAIVAPIAFALSIFPATKGWWNRWLDSLFSWAFLPVPLGFFLYLAGYTLAHGTTAAFTPGTGSNQIVAFLGPFTALFLLFAGLGISLSLAPNSVQGVAKFTRKAATIGVGFLGAQALLKIAENKGVRDVADKWSSAKNPRWGYDKTTGEKKTGAPAAAARALGGVAGFGKRASGKPLEAVLTKGEKTAEEKAHKKAMTANDFQLRALLEDAQTGAEKRGVVRAMLQRRRTKQVLDTDSMTGTPEERKFQRTRLEDSMFGAYENSLAEGDDDTAEGLQRGLWHNPRLVEKMAELEDQRTANNADKYNDVTGTVIDPTTGKPIEGITQADYDRGVRNFKEKIFRGARTQDDFKQFQRSAIQSDEFGKLLHSEHGGAQQATAFVNAYQQEGVRILESHKQPGTHYGEMVQKGVKLDKDNQPILINGEKQPIMEARNLGVARYEAATGGQNTGMSPKEGLERVEDVQRLTKIAKDFAKALEGIQDKATRDAVQTEFETILGEIEDLQGKEDVMKVLAQDRQLSSVFKAIPKENEQARRDVAQALTKIKDTSQWRDIGDILQANPELHHVAPQLADIKEPGKRQAVVTIIKDIENPDARSGIVNVMRQETGFTPEGALRKRQVLQLNQEIENDKAQLARLEATRASAEKRGAAISSYEPQIDNRKEQMRKRGEKLSQIEKELKRWVQDEVEMSEDAEERIPKWQKLEKALGETHWRPEPTPPPTGGAPTGGNPPPQQPPNTGGGGNPPNPPNNPPPGGGTPNPPNPPNPQNPPAPIGGNPTTTTPPQQPPDTGDEPAPAGGETGETEPPEEAENPTPTNGGPQQPSNTGGAEAAARPTPIPNGQPRPPRERREKTPAQPKEQAKQLSRKGRNAVVREQLIQTLAEDESQMRRYKQRIEGHKQQGHTVEAVKERTILKEAQALRKAESRRQKAESKNQRKQEIKPPQQGGFFSRFKRQEKTQPKPPEQPPTSGETPNQENLQDSPDQTERAQALNQLGEAAQRLGSFTQGVKGGTQREQEIEPAWRRKLRDKTQSQTPDMGNPVSQGIAPEEPWDFPVSVANPNPNAPGPDEPYSIEGKFSMPINPYTREYTSVLKDYADANPQRENAFMNALSVKKIPVIMRGTTRNGEEFIGLHYPVAEGKEDAAAQIRWRIPKAQINQVWQELRQNPSSIFAHVDPELLQVNPPASTEVEIMGENE
ncbi:MAG: hypothetical protein UY78_C0011G0004 [Parcubacteria group bacterium GW2011_GWA1_53_13]|nr:MAG: hypothetical protein UY78_C0011G0004 [Parcubacteria group bacterium GW2011_GWA1_53_13]